MKCPDCGKPLLVRAEWQEDGYIRYIGECDRCVNGTPTNWEWTISDPPNKETDLKPQRFFFG